MASEKKEPTKSQLRIEIARLERLVETKHKVLVKLENYYTGAADVLRNMVKTDCPWCHADPHGDGCAVDSVLVTHDTRLDPRKVTR